MALGVVDGEGVREARAATEPVYGTLRVQATSGPVSIIEDVDEPTFADPDAAAKAPNGSPVMMFARGRHGGFFAMSVQSVAWFTWSPYLDNEMPNAV